MPALSKIEDQQDRFGSLVSGLGEAFASELSDMKTAINWYVQTNNGDSLYEKMSAQLAVSFGEIRDVSLGTQISCDSIRSCLDSWLREDIQAVKANQATHVAVLSQHQQSITGLESQVQLLGETCIAQIKNLQDQLLKLETTDQRAQQDLNRRFDLLHGTLQEIKDESAQELERTGTAILTLHNQINECKDTVTKATASVSSPEVAQLRARLHEEESNVARLAEEIRKSKEEAPSSDELREQWARDIDIVNSLRSKLSAAHQRIPRVESIAAKLEGIGRLNEFIRSTADFLANGRDWAQRKLNLELGIDPPCSKISQQDMEWKSDIKIPDVLITQEDKSDPAGEIGQPDLASSEFAPRKVTVLSPALDYRSPSPPPTVAEEQTRRRENVKRRSILRMSIVPDNGQSCSASESLHQPINQSQYNRPVVAQDFIVDSGASHKNLIVERIRSGLVPVAKKESTWAFPTVAEFEESSQATANKVPQTAEKHPRPTVMGDIHGIAKRFKKESKDERLGDLGGAAKPLPKSGGNKGSSTRARPVKTYSRKTDG